MVHSRTLRSVKNDLLRLSDLTKSRRMPIICAKLDITMIMIDIINSLGGRLNSYIAFSTVWFNRNNIILISEQPLRPNVFYYVTCCFLYTLCIFTFKMVEDHMLDKLMLDYVSLKDKDFIIIIIIINCYINACFFCPVTCPYDMTKMAQCRYVSTGSIYFPCIQIQTIFIQSHFQLVIGNYGLSPTQERTQMAMWAMFAAPLIMSVDLRNIRQSSKDILLNPRVIAVNQDKLGIAGRRIVKVSHAGT